MASAELTASLSSPSRGAAFISCGQRGKEIIVKKFIKMLKDISGASAAEYALILAIVGAALAVAAVALGGAIKGAMDNTTEVINNPPAPPAG
jgi:pilus assembly protein Flp/PilA